MLSDGTVRVQYSTVIMPTVSVLEQMEDLDIVYLKVSYFTNLRKLFYKI